MRVRRPAGLLRELVILRTQRPAPRLALPFRAHVAHVVAEVDLRGHVRERGLREVAIGLQANAEARLAVVVPLAQADAEDASLLHHLAGIFGRVDVAAALVAE